MNTTLAPNAQAAVSTTTAPRFDMYLESTRHCAAS
jgi:hypothetical protein